MPPILLLGPAMSGKTTWAGQAAKTLNVPCGRISMSEFLDDKPGLVERALELIERAERDDMLILLDDLELLQERHHNCWHDILMLMENAFQSQQPSPVDVSRITWVCASREVAFMPSFLSRVVVVRASPGT